VLVSGAVEFILQFNYQLRVGIGVVVEQGQRLGPVEDCGDRAGDLQAALADRANSWRIRLALSLEPSITARGRLVPSTRTRCRSCRGHPVTRKEILGGLINEYRRAA